VTAAGMPFIGDALAGEVQLEPPQPLQPACELTTACCPASPLPLSTWLLPGLPAADMMALEALETLAAALHAAAVLDAPNQSSAERCDGCG
jgi:hypothetical protein